MRTVIGGLVVALGMAAAQPALAADGAPAATPLLSAAATQAPAQATSTPFRLQALVSPTATVTRDGGSTALRRRLGTGMMDFFTAGDSGFHLSAGSRLFQRRNFLAETEASAHGLLAGPKAMMGATTTRAGFKKFNPAVTAGYSLAVSKVARIGVEAGAMMNGAFSGTPGLPRFAAGYRGEHEFRPDAIVNAAFGLRF